MGFRFRKSINLGGARINISKSGIGGSVGGKGYRVTKKAGGGTRTTASIPGTGISYQKDSSSKKSGKASTKAAMSAETASLNYINFRFFWICFRLLSVLLIGLGAVLAIIEPFGGLLAIAFGLALWFVASHYKKKYKKEKEGL